MSEVISIVSGEFQLIHHGVYSTLKEAMLHCNRIVACIESDVSNPISLEERHYMLDSCLSYLANVHYSGEKTYEIFDLVDFADVKTLGIDKTDSCIFFTADRQLFPEIIRKITRANYGLCVCELKTFPYRIGDYSGKVSSSSDIRDMHQNAGVPIDLDSTFQQLFPWR